jgi:hypothetical protein
VIPEDVRAGKLTLKGISQVLSIHQGGSLAFYDKSGLERLFCVVGGPPDRRIHIYADQTRSRILLELICRHAVDLYHLVEVYDPEGREVLGFVHRNGMRSTVRELWTIEGPDRAARCRVEEDDTGRHLLRYLLGEHIPSSYRGTVRGRTVFSMIRGLDAGGLDCMAVDFLPEMDECLDARLSLAAALCLFVFSYRFGLLRRLAWEFPRLAPR